MKALMWILIVVVVDVGGFWLAVRFNHWHRARILKKSGKGTV
jgi:hypothetical protein